MNLPKLFLFVHPFRFVTELLISISILHNAASKLGFPLIVCLTVCVNATGQDFVPENSERSSDSKTIGPNVLHLDGKLSSFDSSDISPLVILQQGPLVWTVDNTAVLYIRSISPSNGYRIFRSNCSEKSPLTTQLLFADVKASVPTRLFIMEENLIVCYSDDGLGVIENAGTEHAHLRIISPHASQPLSSKDGHWLAYAQATDTGNAYELHLLQSDGVESKIPLGPSPNEQEKMVLWVTSWDNHNRLNFEYGQCGRNQPSMLAQMTNWTYDTSTKACAVNKIYNRVLEIGEEPGGPDIHWPLRWNLPSDKILTSDPKDMPHPHLEPPNNGPGGNLQHQDQPATKLNTLLLYNAASPQGSLSNSRITITDLAQNGDLFPRCADSRGQCILSAIFHTWRYADGAPWGSWQAKTLDFFLIDVVNQHLIALPAFRPEYWPQRGAVLLLPSSQMILIVDYLPTLFYSSGKINPHHGLWTISFENQIENITSEAQLENNWDASDLVPYPKYCADRLALLVNCDRKESNKNPHRLIVFWKNCRPLTAACSKAEFAIPRNPTWSPNGQLLAFISDNQVKIWHPPVVGPLPMPHN